MSAPPPDFSVLHPIEKAILRNLQPEASKSTENLAATTDLGIDQVRRGIEWLKFKNLVTVHDNLALWYSLDRSGKLAAEIGLPERRLANALKAGFKTLAEIVSSGLLEKDEINASVSAAKRAGWLKFGDGGELELIATDARDLPEEKAIFALKDRAQVQDSELGATEKKGIELLGRRPHYVSKSETKVALVALTMLGTEVRSRLLSSDDHASVRRLTPELLSSGKWRQTHLSPIDVEASAPRIFPGRVHPLTSVIEEIKEIFVGLGFLEIEGSFVQSAFWNFDALYTPQDHPAREMQDTFYISSQRSTVPASAMQVSRISTVHRKGWGSKWSRAEAERLVLRTHTTPITLQFLAAARPDNARCFSVGRVFRNEKPSYKHLVEFHQVEGVATYKEASLRDLIGLQTEFYKKMGIQKIKFWPTFFPYTEPSLQSMVYNESLGKWVELFGMGIFRPEVTGPLGIKNRVLAWGGGLERIAMLRFGLSDVRDLYSGKLTWLRRVPECRL